MPRSHVVVDDASPAAVGIRAGMVVLAVEQDHPPLSGLHFAGDIFRLIPCIDLVAIDILVGLVEDNRGARGIIDIVQADQMRGIHVGVKQVAVRAAIGDGHDDSGEIDRFGRRVYLGAAFVQQRCQEVRDKAD